MDKNLINIGSEELINNLPSAPVDNNKDFQPVSFRQKKMAVESFNTYKVYKTPDEAVTIEAESAAKALEKSGFPSACKIIRALNEQGMVLEQGMLTDSAVQSNT